MPTANHVQFNQDELEEIICGVLPLLLPLAQQLQLPLLQVDEERLLEFVPDWNRNYSTKADFEEFWKQAMVTLGLDGATATPADLPDGFMEAVAPMVLRLKLRAFAEQSAIGRACEGLTAGQAAVKLLRTCGTTLKARSDGGKARREWNAEVEAKAKDIFAELKRSKLKDTPAFAQTSARLAQLGFEFSATTVRRYLKQPNT